MADRAELGYTQERLARAIGVAERTIRRVESGASRPGTAFLRRVASLVTRNRRRRAIDANQIPEAERKCLGAYRGDCVGPLVFIRCERPRCWHIVVHCDKHGGPETAGALGGHAKRHRVRRGHKDKRRERVAAPPRVSTPVMNDGGERQYVNCPCGYLAKNAEAFVAHTVEAHGAMRRR